MTNGGACDPKQKTIGLCGPNRKPQCTLLLEIQRMKAMPYPAKVNISDDT